MPTMMKTVLILLLSLTAAQAFVASRTRASTSKLSMAPKYDGERWEPTSAKEGPEAGYSPTKTLLLHGPKPWFNRVFTPDQYEQAVLKFMAGDKCTRDDAQGNMDAYLRNPNDWAYNRMQEDTKGTKVDYVTLKQEQIILTVVWSTFVLAIVGRAVYAVSNGVDFYAFGPWTGSY
jgi:hypothetical protein